MVLQEQCERTIEKVRKEFYQMEEKERFWKMFFLEHQNPPEGTVDPLILKSWIRCRKRGLDPYHIAREMISQEEMERRCKENDYLIQATRPVFDVFVERMGSRISTLDLYDKDLTFIHTFGDVSPMSARRYAVPGFRCTESTAGVTAMSLAKETGRAAQIIGADHFDASLHDKICTSVPMFNEKQELIGIINMVEQLSVDAPRSLSIMYAIGQGITYSLKLLEQHRSLEKINRINEAILEAIGDGILVVDQEGTIIMMNQVARRLLKMQPGADSLGKKIASLYGEENPFSNALKSGTGINGGELTLQSERGPLRFLGSIRAISGGDEEIKGVIGTFNDIPSTQKVLKSLAGWSATMTFEDILGESPAIRNLVELAKKTADLPSNTLIQGESGTGKEVFAHAIHNASGFANGPFVTINCAAIPNSLLESELFGYESGAYTGAKKNGQPGKFELAQNGTIFLDEINSMPLDMQAKLLRVLQEKAVTRLGGNSKIPLNIKVIASSNTDLQKAVQERTFRADLFYRLNVIVLWIPPLRERIDDLEQMCPVFLKRLCCTAPVAPSISQGAMNLLKNYPWPGNVRELENILERAWVQARLQGKYTIDEASLMGLPEFSRNRSCQEPEPSQTLTGAFPKKTNGEENDVYYIRRQELLDALERNHWNISQSAKELGMARNTLYSRMKQYRIKM